MVHALAVLAGVQAGSRLLLGGDQIFAEKLRRKAAVINSPAQITVGLGLKSDDVEFNSLLLEIKMPESGFQDWLKKEGIWPLLNDGMPMSVDDFITEGDADSALGKSVVQSYKEFELRYPSDPAKVVQLRSSLIEISEIPQFVGKKDADFPLVTNLSLLLIDVAATYLAINPNVLDLDETGGILVQALAANIDEELEALITSPPGQRLGARLLGVVFKSGLKVAHDHRKRLVSKEHSEAMIGALTGPLISVMDGVSMADELAWEDILETLGGQVFSGTINVLLAHQEKVFGSDLAADQAAGKLAKAALTIFSNQATLADTFQASVALELYKETLGIVVKHPELIAKPGSEEAFLTDIITGLASALKAHETFRIGEGSSMQVDPDGLGPALAMAALSTLRDHVGALLNLEADVPLDEVASKALDLVLAGFESGIGEGNSLTEVLPRATFVELTRLFVAQVAQTPEMLIGRDGTFSEELRGIVAGLASALVKDKSLRLLGKDRWAEVAQVALTLAAENPGRVFGLDADRPDEALATIAIKTLLNSAQEALKRGRNAGGVLFGDTLKVAMIDTLNAVARHPDKAALALGVDLGKANLIAEMISELNELSALLNAQGRFVLGAADWTELYRLAMKELLSSLEIERTEAGRWNLICTAIDEGEMPLCRVLEGHGLRFEPLVAGTPPHLTDAGRKILERYVA